MKLLTHHRLDKLGIVVSMACAVHCALMPLAAGALVAAGVSWLAGDLAENLVLSGSLVVGLASLIPSYSRLHRKPYCLALFVTGLLIILATRLLTDSESTEVAGVVTGAVFLVSSHLFNVKLCRNCSTCSPKRLSEKPR